MHKKKVIDLQNYREGEADPVDVPDVSQAETSEYLRPGTALLFGQYTIVGYLNCGGFGITYLAQDSLGRKVAVKECFPGELCYRSGNEMRPQKPAYKVELDSIVDHFIKEAQRLASLKHEYIVHVHQIFEENATAYMVMDFIDGPDFLDIAEGHAPVPAPSDIEVMTVKLLQAIAFVHERGYLHRDISPDNILLGPDRRPVLIDFGSARDTNDKAPRRPSRIKCVKDGYSPQEFYIPGHEQGPWSDLYSFAASLHHVIVGYAPEDGQTRLAALAAKEPDLYQPVAGRVEHFSAPFLKAIDKALEVLPENRIQTAEEWLDYLGEPPEALTEQTSEPEPHSGHLAALGARATSALVVKSQTQKLALMGIGAALVIAIAAFVIFGSDSREENATAGEIANAETVAVESGVPVDADGVASAPADPVELSAAAAVPQTSLAPTVEAAIPDPAPIATDPSEVTPLADARAAAPSLQAQDVAVGFAAPVSSPGNAVPVLDSPAPALSGVDGLPQVRSADAGFVGLPPLPAQPVVGLAAPEPSRPTTDLARLAPLSLASETQVRSRRDALTLPSAVGGVTYSGDVTPPAYVPEFGALLGTQVAFSHWDVDMPFTSTPRQLRNANTVTIDTVDEGADLAVSGAWIKPDTVIYAFNGARLQPEAPLSVHVLNDLNMDPDGYVRATVRYRDPQTGTIDRGLLAVPVVREIGLADGSRLEARMVDLRWQLRVVQAAAGSALIEGDQVLSLAGAAGNFENHEDLAQALDQLAANGEGVAEFLVVRDGQTVDVEWRLARHRN